MNDKLILRILLLSHIIIFGVGLGLFVRHNQTICITYIDPMITNFSNIIYLEGETKIICFNETSEAQEFVNNLTKIKIDLTFFKE